MHYDYVDIGTCDFDTSLDRIDGSNKLNILLVEPIAYYLDKLPNYPNVIKDNIGISNENKKIKLHYLPEDVIASHNLPFYLRGCSSAEDRHPTIDLHLMENHLSLELVETVEIDVITFNTLCEKHQIESIGSLKIDTEGHEQYIVPSVLEKVKQGFIINKIKFENQEFLGNRSLLNQLRDQFVQLGYTLIEQTEIDTVLEKY